jgi:rhamnosyltransferase
MAKARGKSRLCGVEMARCEPLRRRSSRQLSSAIFKPFRYAIGWQGSRLCYIADRRAAREIAMRRVTLFAHFDCQAEVKAYVLTFLRSLKEISEEIIFVSTSPLPPSELERVRPYCSQALLNENRGYDFGMWQQALEHLNVAEVDELILTNSSVFGPLRPLAPIMAKMSDAVCDFWGMTDSFEIHWHLQSYFLVFKKSVLSSPTFSAFFKSILPYQDKSQLIRSYEIGLTQFLLEQGFRAKAFAPAASWLKSARARERACRKRQNPTLFQPMQLIAVGMPLVKVQLLRDNPLGYPMAPVVRAMAESGYDLSNLQFDRAPSVPKTLVQRFRRWRHPPLTELPLTKPVDSSPAPST